MTAEASNQPLPKVCCCRSPKPNEEGLIIINCGCKIHGLGVDIDFYARRTVGSSREMQIPNQAVRNGTAKWHRISEVG
jgi:hypothetical protein